MEKIPIKYLFITGIMAMMLGLDYLVSALYNIGVFPNYNSASYFVVGIFTTVCLATLLLGSKVDF